LQEDPDSGYLEEKRRIMMIKEIVTTSDAPAPAGAYSQAVKAGNLVFTQGTGPIDADSGKIVAPGNIADQTRKTLENIRLILEKAGTSLENAVKVTAFIHDINEWSKFNEAYAEYFKENPPARTTVEVGHFTQGFCVEIDVIAIVP